MLPIFYLLPLAILVLTSGSKASIWCYSCVSTQPGCTDHGVNWFLHSAITCPRDDDKCIKIIEERSGEKLITRDCLSNLVGKKSNIPGDTYEGCRPAADQPMLAVYVDNQQQGLDLKRTYWKNTTYCFCQLDHWCNSSVRNQPEWTLIGFAIAFFIVSNK